MDSRRLAASLGSPIISDDTAIVQFDKIVVGTMVESLIIEFD